MNKNAKEKELLEEAYASIYLEAKEAPKGKHYDSAGRLRSGDADADGRGGPKYRSDPTYDNPNDPSDEEQPRDSMYLKDDPEALKRALAWHRNNVAKLRRKSMLDLTDEEYDSLKHSEGELELNEGEEDYVRLTKGSTFNVTNVNVPKKDKELIDHYMKKGFKEVKKSEDNETLKELETLIAVDIDEEDKDEEEDIDIKQGGGTSAAEFEAEDKTGYA
tara:strand:+ start:1015 stop:1668 length:654 start_codon:yes stop_codon:yes gene_type:complete